MKYAMICGMSLCLVGMTFAAPKEGKEVTLKGNIVCTKCALKQTKKCANAILIKKDGKELTYLFKDKGGKEKYHGAVCGGERKPGTVVGKIAKKDGKLWITPSKVEYKKKN